MLVKRLDTLEDRQLKELYEGFLFDEPVTIKFSQIRHIDSTRTNLSLLYTNLRRYDGVIDFKGSKAASIAHSDYLVTVFESYKGSIETLTTSGRLWSETEIINAVIDLTVTASTLVKAGLRESLSLLCPGRILVTAEGGFKLRMLKKRFKKQAKLNPYLPTNYTNETDDWAPYALGATALYMALRRPASQPRDWMVDLPSIQSSHPVLYSILGKLLAPREARYSFSDLRNFVNLGVCFSIVRLNDIIRKREVKAKKKEVDLLLRNIECKRYRLTAVKQVEQARRQMCVSCLMVMEVGMGTFGYRCGCGVVNLVQ